MLLLVWASADNFESGGNPKATHITEEKVHHIVKTFPPPPPIKKRKKAHPSHGKKEHK